MPGPAINLDGTSQLRDMAGRWGVNWVSVAEEGRGRLYKMAIMKIVRRLCQDTAAGIIL